MTIHVRVFKAFMLVKVDHGYHHKFYDWWMLLDLIRHDDKVIVSVWCYSDEATNE